MALRQFGCFSPRLLDLPTASVRTLRACALAALLALLAACGGSGSDDPPGGADAQQGGPPQGGVDPPGSPISISSVHILNLGFWQPLPQDSNFAIGDSPMVAVIVGSTYEVDEVIARVGGVDTRLPYVPSTGIGPALAGPRPGYRDTVSFAGQAVGAVTLEIRARDVRGNESVRSYSVIHDNPPQLSVTQPDSLSVSLGTLRVDASCSDDSGTCTVDARIGQTGPPLASGQGRVVGTINLPPPYPRQLDVWIVASDQRHTTMQGYPVYLEDPARLSVVAEVPGEIIDARGTRVLYVIDGDTGDRLIIRDMTTGADEEIPLVGRSIRPTHAFLVSDGAVFESRPVNGSPLYASLWRFGALTDVATMTDASLAVGGDFAIFSEAQTNANILRRLDTTSGVFEVVTTALGSHRSSVAADGTVVFSSGGPAHQLYRYRAGMQVALTNAPNQSHVWPRTDGDNTVFAKAPASQAANEVALIEGTTETSLASALMTEPQAGADYAIANGWVAFTRPNAQSQEQVFVRSPVGAVQQRTIFSGSSRIDNLRGNGDLLFINQTQRYFSDSVDFVPISSSAGESFLLNDRWHIAIRGTLLQVDTNH
jgi:hypothetical protein